MKQEVQCSSTFGRLEMPQGLAAVQLLCTHPVSVVQHSDSNQACSCAASMQCNNENTDEPDL